MPALFSILHFLLAAPFAIGGIAHTGVGDPKLYGYDLFQRNTELYPHEILLKGGLHGLSQGKVFIAHEIGNVGDFGIGKGQDIGLLGHSIGGHGHGFGSHGHGFGSHGHGFGSHGHGFGSHGDIISHESFGGGGKRGGSGLDVITVPVVKNVPVVKHVPVVKKVPVVKTVDVVRHVPVLKNVPVVQHVTVIANDGRGGAGGSGLSHGVGKGGLGNTYFGGGHGLGKGEYEAGYYFGGGHHDGW